MISSSEFKRKILGLLKEDEEFRYAVAGLTGLEEILKRFEQHDKELIELRKDLVEGFKRRDKEITELRVEIVQLRKDMLEGFKLLERHINALGLDGFVK